MTRLIAVIRAYGAQSRFIGENDRRVDVHLQCTFLNDIAFRWLGIRVEYLGNAIILLTGIFTNYYRQENCRIENTSWSEPGLD